MLCTFHNDHHVAQSVSGVDRGVKKVSLPSKVFDRTGDMERCKSMSQLIFDLRCQNYIKSILFTSRQP